MGDAHDWATGVDLRASGPMRPEEREGLRRWYERTHGDPSLWPYVTFWLDRDPDVLRRFRRWAETVPPTPDGVPSAAVGLLFLHLYTVIGYDNGVRYEVIAARETGASRAEVLHTLALAFVHAGPAGMTRAALAIGTDLDDEDDAPSRVPWPEAWRPRGDTDPFDAGLDATHDGLTPAELASLRAWHVATQGAVPEHVEYLATRLPEALKVSHLRWAASMRGPLPPTMAVLMQLQLAIMRGDGGAIRRMATHARALGASPREVAHVAALSQVYLGETAMDRVARHLVEAEDA